jgi:ribosomal protein S24E
MNSTNQGDKELRENTVRELIEELAKIEGKNVLINIGHKLYGDQKVQCAFHILNNEEHLGFSINGQEIYIEKSKICSIEIIDDLYYFSDGIMCLQIRKLNVQ